MQVKIACMQSLPADRGGGYGKTDLLTVSQPSSGYAMRGLDRRAVELVTSQRSPCTSQKVITICDDRAIAQHQPRCHDRVNLDRSDHGQPIDAATQVEQPGTLGNRWHAG